MNYSAVYDSLFDIWRYASFEKTYIAINGYARSSKVALCFNRYLASYLCFPFNTNNREVVWGKMELNSYCRTSFTFSIHHGYMHRVSTNSFVTWGMSSKNHRSIFVWNVYHICVKLLKLSSTLQWRHDECNGALNHRLIDCFFNRSFRRRSKKTSKLSVTCLCEGNSPVPSEISAQRANTAENVSIWWRHHDAKYGNTTLQS